jgi:hypothetical protein
MILLIVVTGFVLYLLFIPLILEVDTIRQDYYLRIGTLALIKLEPHTDKLMQLRLRTLYRNFYFYPLTYKSTEKKTSPAQKKKKQGIRKIKIRTVLKIVRSFKVKKLKVVMDTGNWIVNSKWYPVFYFMNEYGGKWAINYEGKNSLQLRVMNRPVYLLKSFINN